MIGLVKGQVSGPAPALQVVQPWARVAPSSTREVVESFTPTATSTADDAAEVPTPPSGSTLLRRGVALALALTATFGGMSFLAPTVTAAGSVSQASTTAEPVSTRAEKPALGVGQMQPGGYVNVGDARTGIPIFEEAAAPAPRAYPRLETRKGDYVAHGVNFSSLISNEEFTDANAMSVEDVQKIFEQRRSFLAEYVQDGRSAAQIVVDAATASQVNPRIVLATLEKETSLVSRQSSPPRWMMRSAMGYAYTDGGGTAGRQSSFAYQVENGTRLLRELYNEGLAMDMPAQKSVDYGSRTINVNNAATWALMRYTPHTRDTQLRQIGGGNYLFQNVLTDMQVPSAEQRL